MAGVAGHDTSPTEVGSIDGVHHPNHLACRLLQRSVVGVPCPAAAAFLDMALRAVHARGGGKEPHRAHEFLHGNSPEQLDVVNTSSAICTFCSGAVCSAWRAWPPADAALVNHTADMVPKVTRNLTRDFMNTQCRINVLASRHRTGLTSSTLGTSGAPAPAAAARATAPFAPPEALNVLPSGSTACRRRPTGLPLLTGCTVTIT